MTWEHQSKVAASLLAGLLWAVSCGDDDASNGPPATPTGTGGTSAGGSGGSGGDGGADGGGGHGGAGAIHLDHFFAFIACENADPSFCSTGEAADFDRAAFRDLYVDPFGAGPPLGYYANSADGSYAAYLAPQCDDSSIDPPVTASSDSDPATWQCPDGQSTIRCTDGTRPVVHYFPSPGSDKWLIGISNGGSGCAGEICPGAIVVNHQRYSSSLDGPGDSKTPDHKFSSGIFQLADFDDYHRVMIDQCAGGRGLGTNDAVSQFQHPGSGDEYEVPLYHHGSRIVLATLDQILRMAASPPTQVVLASQSNGSRGAYTEIDGWKAWLDAHPLSGGNVDVRLYANSLLHDNIDLESCHNDPGCTDLLDSFDHTAGGWNALSAVISAPGSTDLATTCPPNEVGKCLSEDGAPKAEVPANGITCNTLDYLPEGFEGAAAAEWGITPDSSCLAAHPNEPSACLDPMHVLLYHVTTPTYLALSGYDRFMRSENVTPCTAPYEAWSLEDYNARCVAFASSLRRTKPGQKDPVLEPGHGVWIDNSADHKGPTNNHKLERELQLDAPPDATISLLTSMRNWLDATADHTPLCISDGDPEDDPTNPMNTNHGGTPVSAVDCF